MGILNFVSGSCHEEDCLLAYPSTWLKEDALDFVNSTITEVHAEIRAEGKTVKMATSEILERVLERLFKENFQLVDEAGIRTKLWAVD